MTDSARLARAYVSDALLELDVIARVTNEQTVRAVRVCLAAARDVLKEADGG